MGSTGRVAPNPVRAGSDVAVATAAGDGGAVELDGGEALDSAVGLAPAQPASTRTATTVLAAVKDFTEGR